MARFEELPGLGMVKKKQYVLHDAHSGREDWLLLTPETLPETWTKSRYEYVFWQEN